MDDVYRGISGPLLLQVRAILENFRFGIHESVRKGEGMNFAAIREYQEGESLRRVDWMRSLERSPELDELMIREFEPEKQMQVTVILDAARGLHVPERKGKIAVALLWLALLSAFKMRDIARVIIAFDADEGGIVSSPMLSVEQDADEFLRAVSEGHVPTHYPRGATALEVLGGSLPNDTFLVAISDFEREDGFLSRIAEVSAPSRHSRLLVVAVDGWESVSPVSSLLSIQEGGRKSSREIDGRSGGELDLMKRRIRERQEAVLANAWKRGHIAARVPVFSERPFEELVRKLSIANL